MASATSTTQINIAETLSAWARGFERTLRETLIADSAVPDVLAEAVFYSLHNGGKRIRPFIVTRFCELCGGSAERAVPAAVAIECVHAFSLVHDDLPAMDDDDLRRGQPTCHKKFGEAVAILAGDALLAAAFEILARIPDSRVATRAVSELARGCGWAGMIGGQTLDIISEQKPPELERVKRIHRCKTARLFESAARLGTICAETEAVRSAAAGIYGEELGRAFQIADDLLDVTGTAGELGKAVAKDAGAGKQTYPAAVGVEASRRAAEKAVDRAVEALEIFGPAADDLRCLARFVVERGK